MRVMANHRRAAAETMQEGDDNTASGPKGRGVKTLTVTFRII